MAGSDAQIRSEITDKTIGCQRLAIPCPRPNLLPCAMMMFMNWCFERHVPCTLTLHHAPSGLQIPSNRKTLIMLKETIAAIKAYIALVTVLVFTMRSRKRQIETLISMHVMKICTKSVQPRASTFFCCVGVRK